MEGGTPANNCFTHQGSPSPGFTVFDITGFPSKFDYIDPIEEEIDCRFPIIAHPNVNVLLTNFDAFICEIDEGGFSEECSSLNFDQSLFDNYEELGSYVLQNDYVSARAELTTIHQNSEEGIELNYMAESLISILEKRGSA